MDDLAAIRQGLLRLRSIIAAERFSHALYRHYLALKAGYRPDQLRDELGKWADEGSARRRVQLAENRNPPLRHIHPDSTYQTDPEARRSLEFWRQQPTQAIVESLRPGQKEPLRVYPDGGIADGNTRIKVLQERGYDINSLPRVPRGSSGGSGRGGGGIPPKLPPPRF